MKNTVKNLPTQSGVYLMKSRAGRILYIGKAKSLRSRVISHFNRPELSLKNHFLIRQISAISYIVTANEEEACLLEASLIKKHKPRYNVRLKDDKAYPYIRLSREDFPRLYFERRVRDRKSLYFGPYTQGGAVRAVMDFLNHTFQLRDCADRDFKNRKRPCLTHQMGFCSAPCVRLVGKEEYGKQAQKALEFLRGSRSGLISGLKKQMKQRAGELRFEEAERLRQSLKAVEMIEQKQLAIQKSEKSRDVICVAKNKDVFLTEFLHLRKGRLIGARHQFFNSPFEEAGFFSFLRQYYNENLIPDEIVIGAPVQKSQFKLLERVLSLQKTSSCCVKTPEKKQDILLMDRARQNAESHFRDALSQNEDRMKVLEEIQKKFRLPALPRRMEGCDISHWQGKEAFGSQAVFENGLPKKEDYRLYGLKESKPGDDCGGLREVLRRRFSHREYEDPDLLLIDGGRSQLKAAQKALKEAGKQIPLLALAKDRVEKSPQTAEKYQKALSSSGERFYLPGRKNPLTFTRPGPALHLLLRLRDEAHRFALRAFRKKTAKNLLQRKT